MRIARLLNRVFRFHAIDKDVSQRRLREVGIEPAGCISLLVRVDEEDAEIPVILCKCVGEVDADGGLPDPAFPVDDADGSHDILLLKVAPQKCAVDF